MAYQIPHAQKRAFINQLNHSRKQPERYDSGLVRGISIGLTFFALGYFLVLFLKSK